eukprot:941502-Pelagomonas_calceolata.AAC.1
MDVMLTGKDQSQADQPNTLAEGPPCKSKSKSLSVSGVRLTRESYKAPAFSWRGLIVNYAQNRKWTR